MTYKLFAIILFGSYINNFICKFILNAIFLPSSDNPSSDASLSVQFTLSSRLTIQNYN